MKVNGKMENKMVMEDIMKVCGQMESQMVMVKYFFKMELCSLVNGQMEQLKIIQKVKVINYYGLQVIVN